MTCKDCLHYEACKNTDYECEELCRDVKKFLDHRQIVFFGMHTSNFNKENKKNSKFFKLVPDDIKKDCFVVTHVKGFGKQVGLHEYLQRKLLKFAYENGYEDSEPWDDETAHYSIYYDTVINSFEVAPIIGNKYFEVYFSCEEGAEQAIEKVVKPFMKEHPDFVW